MNDRFEIIPMEASPDDVGSQKRDLLNAIHDIQQGTFLFDSPIATLIMDLKEQYADMFI